MNRRHFLRNGLWVSSAIAFPAIVRAQVLPSARRIAAPKPAASGAAFTYSDISGLVMWLDASETVYHDSGTTLCTNGQTVYHWVDKAGASIDAVALNAAATWVSASAGLNNKPAVAMANNDMLYVGSTPAAMTGTARTVVMVFYPTTTAANQYFVSVQRAGGQMSVYGMPSGGDNRWVQEINGYQYDLYDSSPWAAKHYIINTGTVGAASLLYVDGTLQITSSNNLTAHSGGDAWFFLGSSFGWGDLSTMSVGLVLVWNKVLSSGERASVAAKITTDYGF